MNYCRTVLGFVLIFCLLATSNLKNLSIVIWHGLGDDGTADGMKELAELIEQTLPGTYVLNLNLGTNYLEEVIDAFHMKIKQQLIRTCKILKDDPKLRDGYHLIGLSQGGLFVRALVQYCPPPIVGSVISIGAPQQGVYGMPKCSVRNYPLICNILRMLLSTQVYIPEMQSLLAQSQYWHDPLQEEMYREKSQFLSEFNQEKTINLAYAENMRKIQNLVLVRFMNDSVVIPAESEWFGFYLPGNIKETYTIYQSKQYLNDTLGLKTLDSQGRLHLLSVYDDHLQFSDDWFKSEIIKRFLST